VKAPGEADLEVRFTNRVDAPEVRITEESVIKQRYPLTYSKLVGILKERYSDFKLNNKFNVIKKGLEDASIYGEKFCKTHRLNVVEDRGSPMKFYSPEMIKEFDMHYTRKKL
jgi:hypothetical protein